MEERRKTSLAHIYLNYFFFLVFFLIKYLKNINFFQLRKYWVDHFFSGEKFITNLKNEEKIDKKI